MNGRINAIEVSNLAKGYKGVPVLHDVSFTVGQGTVFALLGANGSGKTTTINILTTLLDAEGGTASVAGFDVAEQPAKVREQISLSGQFAAVDDVLTARENLVLIGELRHVANPADRGGPVDTFDLNEAADRRLLTFSGGMRRRLDIAMSLVGDSPIIFFDEPTTGLDPKSRTDMWGTIRQLVDHGTTVFLTTQYLEEADRLADHIAILHGGRIVARGTPDELKATVPPGLVELEFSEEANWRRRSEHSASGTRSAGWTRSWSSPPPARWPTWPTCSSGSRTAGSSRPGSPGSCRRSTTCSSRSSTTTRRTAMRSLTDTWTMTKRSLPHTTRSLDTMITVVITPIAMLLFVYVFGGALGEQTGSIDYVNYVTPAVVIMTVVSGIAYAALRLATDLQKGIISRFRTMPVTPSSVLTGQALSSTLSNLFSCSLVIMVALVVGFRPEADTAAWLTSARSWSSSPWPPPGSPCSSACWRNPRRRRGLQLHPAAADLHQPLIRPDRLDDATAARLRREPTDDPIIETMRSLLTEGTPGPDIGPPWAGLSWSSPHTRARVYRRSAPVPAAQ